MTQAQNKREKGGVSSTPSNVGGHVRFDLRWSGRRFPGCAGAPRGLQVVGLELKVSAPRVLRVLQPAFRPWPSLRTSSPNCPRSASLDRLAQAHSFASLQSLVSFVQGERADRAQRRPLPSNVLAKSFAWSPYGLEGGFALRMRCCACTRLRLPISGRSRG